MVSLCLLKNALSLAWIIEIQDIGYRRRDIYYFGLIDRLSPICFTQASAGDYEGYSSGTVRIDSCGPIVLEIPYNTIMRWRMVATQIYGRSTDLMRCRASKVIGVV